MKTYQQVLLLTAVLMLPAWLLLKPASQANTEPASSDNQTLQVKTVSPESLSSSGTLQFNARLEAAEQTDIYARADGYLEKRLVDIGDEVKQGDLLAVLSSPELEKQINQAKAEINRQQAMVSLTEKTAKRYQLLRDSGAVNANEVDESEAELEVAEATLATFAARLEELENEFAYTKITAPYGGFITRRHAERGNRVSRDDTMPLFRLSRTDTLRVVVNVPQTQLFALDQKQPAELALPEKPAETFKVTLQRSSRELDASNGTMRLEYHLDNENAALPAGLSGSLQITTRNAGQQFRIPINALKNQQGQPVVMIVDGDNKVAVKKVVVGRLGNQLVDILGGLEGDEDIILNPNARLEAGMAVEISKKAS